MTGRNVVDTVAICNQSLRHLAQTAGIVDFDNDESEAAEACRVFFPTVIDEVLTDFPWSFARKFGNPALVTGPSPAAVDGQWLYSYRVPTDCLQVRRIVNPTEPVRTSFNTIPYLIGQDDSGLLIFCNVEPVAATDTTAAQPQIEYTMTFESSAFWPSQFGQMASLLLASYIAPSLTAGDKFKLGQRAIQLYDWARQRAQNTDANQAQADLPPDANWIEARGGEGNSVWPFGLSNWQAFPSSLP